MSNEPAPIRSEIFGKTGGIVREWAMWFQHAYENFKALLADVATLKAVTHYFGPTTQTDVTASRALGTVYQNTTGKPMRVDMAAWSTQVAGFTSYVGASNPPTVITDYAYGSSATAGYSQHFLVMPGQYYKVTVSLGIPTLYFWIESY